MLQINIDKDENLQDAYNVFISALLPHESYDSKFYIEILQTIFQYVRLEEFSGPYYVLLKILNDLKDLKIRFENYSPCLTRDSLSNTLEIAIADSILDPHVRMKDILDSEGLPNRLEIETVKETACHKLYSMTMELYDECFALEENSEEVLNNIPMLKSAFLAHVSTESIQTQVNILQNQQMLDRKNYSGSEDWINYIKQIKIELQERLAKEENTIVSIDTVDGGLELLSSLRTSYQSIATYGIPEIDYLDPESKTLGTPILLHRLVVVIGAVNIGKSMFCIWQTARILSEGKKVVYMYGESLKSKIYAQIMIAYIWIKYHKSLLMEHLINPDSCTDEIRKIIVMAISETMGLLFLKDSYSYDDLYDELVADYDKREFDAIFIDHSFALSGLSMRDNGKSSIDKLSVHLRNFKRKYPVFVCVASHPSTDARTAMAKDKAIKDSPTKGSSNLFGEADDVYILKDNEALQKQEQIMIENKKRRDAPVLRNPIILRKRFNCYCFEYDANLQYDDAADDSTAASALMELDRAYGDDNDLYNLDAY